MKRSICVLIVAVLLVCCILSSCGKVNTGPEVGEWHARLKMSDIDIGSLSDDEKALISLVTGETALEIDAQFSEDGTFLYQMNSDKLEQSISEKTNTIISLFTDVDLSYLVNNIVSLISKQVFTSDKRTYYGKYSSEKGKITAVDEDTLYFITENDQLIQLDRDGNVFARFDRAE